MFAVSGADVCGLLQLGVENEKVTSRLLSLLDDEVWEVRVAAARALQKIKVDLLATYLYQALADENAFVRRKAAETVGYYAENEQVFSELLRLATSDPVDEVRRTAAEAHEKYRCKFAYFDKTALAFSAAEQGGQALTLEGTREFIAHEVRSALGPIAGYAKMLDEALAQESSADGAMKKFVQQILKQTNVAQEVVNKYVDYTRPLHPDLKPTSVNDVVEETLREVLPDCERLGVNLAKHIEPNCEAVADAKMLAQVFRNVLRNAIEAMEQDRRPEAEKQLELAVERHNRRVLVIIRDTGPGLSTEAQKRVFELGFSTKLGKQGAGVGLALVRRILKEGHRGDISIKNNDSGSGAVVTVELPATNEAVVNGRQ